MFISDVETDFSPGRGGAVSNSFYEIAGRRLSVSVDAEWAAAVVVAFLQGFHLAPTAEGEGDDGLRLTVSTAEPPPAPVGGLRFDVPGGTCRADARRYSLELNQVAGSRVEVAPREERRVSVWVGRSRAGGTRDDALITVMAYALPAALRRLGLYDLHACGMVEPATGHAFVFAGASASGKTSLALRLAAAGWGYTSDDLLTILEDEAGEGVEARPLRRHFQTDAAALAGCQLPRLEEALGPPIPNAPEKRRLDPSVIFPGRLVSAARPRVLCFPSVAGGVAESRVAPLSRAEAMTRLVKMCPWSSYDISAAREHLRLLGRLVGQCRTYTLSAGRDIFDDPSQAARLLAPLA